MYDVSAAINNIELIKTPLNENFQINFDDLERYLDDERLKLIFICSPNNPTGNIVNDIDKILKKFNGIVFVDEAYIDFSSRDSYVAKLLLYPNLIVSQTFSKAWGLAAARVGTAYASAEIISLYNKVKPPYNVSKLNQEAAIKALEEKEAFGVNRQEIITQRKRLLDAFQNIFLIKKVYPTDANFMLIEVNDADDIYKKLVSEKVITRNRNNVVKNCIRITVGSKEENEKLLLTLKNIK